MLKKSLVKTSKSFCAQADIESHRMFRTEDHIWGTEGLLHQLPDVSPPFPKTL